MNERSEAGQEPRIRVGACAVCRQDVVRIPTADGTALLFELNPQPSEQAGEDGYVVMPAYNSNTRADNDEAADERPDDRPQNQTIRVVLRTHACPGPPTEPQRRPRPREYPTSRNDYQDLRTLTTQIELFRAQTRGTLRTHPGQRTYSAVQVTRQFAAVANWNPDQCILCKRPLAPNQDSLLIAARSTPPGREYMVCYPTCDNQNLTSASEG